MGTFIARISRGRTVREFLVSVLLVPSCVCILWMSAFGASEIPFALVLLGMCVAIVKGLVSERRLLQLGG